MCGIVGIASSSSINEKGWLSLGRDEMFHRGPNEFGEWWSPDLRVGLAHRRLAIVDLSSKASQPMFSSAHGLAIIFNGEIYNHLLLREQLSRLGFSFRSKSDTEVLLAAYAIWGESCLEHLNGMFAFAIYDEKQQKLFLARDRVGEKPLFYQLKNNCLQFASELKALLANPKNSKCIDKDALDCYLAMGYVPGEKCILQGYKKLPAAHAMRFDLKSGLAKIWRYWMLPEFESNQCSLDDGSLLHELEYLLEDSVRRQMVADVPVGVLLSGGVDSSLITAMAVRASSQVQTFTIGFPGHRKLDETEHARLIARHFGTRHTELMAEDASVAMLPRLASQFDEPIVDSSMIPTFLVSQLVRQHCTVALGGDGGDELFGGYTHYSRLLMVQHKSELVPYSLRRFLSMSAEKFLPIGFKGRNWLQSLAVNLDNDLPLIASLFDKKTRRRLLKDNDNWPSVAESIWMAAVPLNADIVQRATRMDFCNYLVEDILVKVDRASMLSSLELRAPLLDQSLIEFAFRKVPSQLKATSTEKKILLKRLAARLLPSGFDRQRKQGFSIPLGEWLKNEAFGKLFSEVLCDPQCSFNRIEVDNLFRGQKKGRNNGERLFALVLFELWRREYGATF